LWTLCYGTPVQTSVGAIKLATETWSCFFFGARDSYNLKSHKYVCITTY